MDRHHWLSEEFEQHRGHLRAVAYRMLGSLHEADDAVQEAWLQLNRADAARVDNLGGWLTTVVARVCLNMLRTRQRRREEPLATATARDQANRWSTLSPEDEATMSDAVGPALLVVLDLLSPPERLAFVLHDMFAVPYNEIGHLLGRSPVATRQLASRARRRVHGGTVPTADLARQTDIVDAFLTASRHGNFSALLAILDPDVILRADAAAARPGMPTTVHGAENVARGALSFSGHARYAQPALVNGAVGAVVAPRGRLFVVLAFEYKHGKISSIDVIADQDRVERLDLSVLQEN
jgi:RNA polymerase sigma factor (sigma-70 family)